jgi:hypothetical protein
MEKLIMRTKYCLSRVKAFNSKREFKRAFRAGRYFLGKYESAVLAHPQISDEYLGEIHRHMAFSCIPLERFDEALHELECARNYLPNCQSLRSSMITVYFQKGEGEKALTLLTSCFDGFSPIIKNVMLSNVRVAIERGDLDEELLSNEMRKKIYELE